MSTLVLEVKFIDGTQSQDIEFNSLESLSIWLRGQCESDFSWLTLHDNNNDYVFDSWDDIFQYINENNGPVLHDLSVCGDACNCMKCNPSKSSCIALRTSELNIEVINHPMAPTPEQGDMSGLPVPVGTVTFGELEDGAEFYVAMTWAYGSRNKLQKVMEDGEHNAVWCSATHIGELIPDGIRVVRA